MPDPTPYPLDQLTERGDAQASALVLRDRTLTYADLRERVSLLAGWLAGKAEPGARVASWAAKGELTCLLPLAAARAGMVHVPINPLLKRAQVAHILSDSGAVLLMGTEARLATLEGAFEAHGAEGAVAAELLGVLDAGGRLGEPELGLLRLARGLLSRSFGRGRHVGVS